jgi:hypothetical protein
VGLGNLQNTSHEEVGMGLTHGASSYSRLPSAKQLLIGVEYPQPSILHLLRFGNTRLVSKMHHDFVTLLGLPLALLTVTIIAATARALLSPLKSVPGPFLARFTNAWYFWKVKKAHFEQENQALHERYGLLR